MMSWTEWADLIKEFLKYSAPIMGVISILITLFNKEHSKYEKNEEKYFDNFLVSFYNNYRANNNMNIRKFLNKNYNYLDNYISGYVNYLMENKEYEKLKEILIVDYFYYCTSVKNSMKNTFNKIFNPIYFIEYCMFFLSIIFLSFFAVTLVPMTIEEIVGRIKGTYSSSVDGIPAPMFFILMLIVLGVLSYLVKVILDSQWINKDMYTCDEKYIKKIIKSREEKYKKMKNTIYFL